MRKACIVVDKFYSENKLFDLNDSIINRDNCVYFFYILKLELEKNGIDLSTQDINSIEESEIVIYNEMPKKLPLEKDIQKSYLLIFETELIKKENWDFDKHNNFDKIFTWDDKVVDNKKYFKFNFSHKIPEITNFDLSKKEKLCTLIAGNKKNSDKRELYSKRIEAIRWFEKNHPEDFDLYGIGWDKRRFNGNKILRLLNRVDFFCKIFYKKYPSYQGIVKSKNKVLAKYKFCICYENAKDINGYITEKIFDCFFAGCVPIYFGAPNITNFIPENCFIDKRKFRTYNELFEYLNNMDDETYYNYQKNIIKFLNSNESNPFSAEKVSKDIVTLIV